MVEGIAGPPPLKETATRSSPKACLSLSPAREPGVPRPAGAQLYWAGLAFREATSSFTLAAGTEGCTSNTCGDTPTSDTGARSLEVSKPSLANRLGLTTSELLMTRMV